MKFFSSIVVEGVEFQHKTLQKSILITLQKDENSNLIECIYDYLYNYNLEHWSIGHKPI